MNDFYNERLAVFNQYPIQDIRGVVTTSINWVKRVGESDLFFSNIYFGAFRIGDGEIQFGQLEVELFLPESEKDELIDRLGKHKIVHIKAHLREYEHGARHAFYKQWVGPADDDEKLAEIYHLVVPVPLVLPPLPPLKLRQYSGWHGTIIMPSWASYYAFLESPDNQAEREYELAFTTEDMPAKRIGYKGVPPTPAQIAAYEYLLENEAAIHDAIFQYIFEQYPQWQEWYGGDEEYMPNVSSPTELESLVGLRSIRIEEDEKQGIAYVYFRLNPEWDPEHGIAAIVHQTRVVTAGDHDSMWRATERDA